MITSGSPIHVFLIDSLGSYESVERLTGDASTREYYRVSSNGRKYILCRDGILKQHGLADYPFCKVYRLFRRYHIPVPEVYKIFPSDGLLLIQDLGNMPVEDMAGMLGHPETVALYRTLLDIVVAIQSIPPEAGDVPFSLSFNETKLMEEFDFFIKHCLANLYGVADAAATRDLRMEFSRMVNKLYRPDLFVLNHRDYHSRNILWHDGSPVVIDFQDSRMGLPQYDVVSLLRDSYVRLDDGTAAQLSCYYHETSLEAGIHRMNTEEYDHYFSLMAFQRNVKALGTFGYQATVMNRHQYRKYIPPTLGYLAAYGEKAPEVRKAAGIILDVIGDRA